VPREGTDLNLRQWNKDMWDRWVAYALSLGFDLAASEDWADQVMGRKILPACKTCGGIMDEVKGACYYCPICLPKSIAPTEAEKLHFQRLLLWQEASKHSDFMVGSAA
jgi:hypothetical protein